MSASDPTGARLPGVVEIRPSKRMTELRDREELDLQSKGISIPAYHRRVWADAVASVDTNRRRSGLVRGLSEVAGESRFLRLESWPSRSVPGYRHLLLPHIGRFVPTAAFESALAALVDYSQRSRVLRLTVELFESDEASRFEFGRIATRLGLWPNPAPIHYPTTLRVALDRSSEEVMASFSRRCRRAIRRFEAGAYRVERIRDAHFDSRIQQLADETFSRTKGEASQTQFDWAFLRRLQDEAPDVACLVGIFDERLVGDESLVGVAYGLNHGEVAVYEFGASSRDAEDDLPLGYALVWQLIRWAGGTGSQWFDLGGCWNNPGADVAGIEAFKRSFSKDEIVVREEYVLEPSPVLSGFDRALRSVAARLRAKGVDPS